ncbi:MAG: right-handed parallel beta-helix repeat-containing protein [Deltaproteobacteria bacterium]|nr:MAG: right-handed parallel beta-helix repeat-containing protein [Deltaproteobacteria bacterium]
MKRYVCASALLLLIESTAHAATLSVNCGSTSGFNSIGAALKVLQAPQVSGPNTISVSGACHENVTIQRMDRLTLTAVNGASVSDASGGNLDVIAISDSRDVSINGFTVNGGSGNGNGVSCNDFSTCRLSGNVIQGAGSGGFAVFSQSQATLDGDTLQNNAGAGLLMRSGSKVRGGLRPFTSRGNGQGINIGRQAFAFIEAVIQSNVDQGVVVQFQSTLELNGGSISGNGSVGAHVREGSVARFTTVTISGNAGAGVLVHDLSMVTFNGATVTGNGGGTDVVCNPQFAATRGATTDIGGGSTNCADGAPSSANVVLTSAHISGDQGSSVLRAFILTDSADPICFVTFNESNSAGAGESVFCGARAPSLYSGRPGVMITVFFPGPVASNVLLSLNVQQNGAKAYGQPVACTPADGC